MRTCTHTLARVRMHTQTRLHECKSFPQSESRIVALQALIDKAGQKGGVDEELVRVPLARVKLGGVKSGHVDGDLEGAWQAGAHMHACMHACFRDDGFFNHIYLKEAQRRCYTSRMQSMLHTSTRPQLVIPLTFWGQQITDARTSLFQSTDRTPVCATSCVFCVSVYLLQPKLCAPRLPVQRPA